MTGITVQPVQYTVEVNDTGYDIISAAVQGPAGSGGGGGGSGTVTSVGVSAPSLFAVAGSPVTTSGTIAIALAAQAANTVLAGPTSGANAAPTMRPLVAADLPANVAVKDADNAFSAAQTAPQLKTALVTSTGTLQLQAGASLRFLIQDTSNAGGAYVVHNTALVALVAQSIAQATQPEFLVWGAAASVPGVNGGNLVLQGGTKSTGGVEGSVVVRAQSAAPSDLLQIQDSAKVKHVWVDSSFVLHGDGSGLTLDGSNITAGTVPDARLSANVPILTGGKLPTSMLPALAITEFLGTVASQAAMLALTGQRGDWCIRSDDAHVYILITDDPTQAANWQAISYPAAPVTAVNGHTGNVTLAAADVGAQPASANLTTLAGVTPSAAGTALLAAADAAAQRTDLGLGSLATKSTVALATDVTGVLPAGNLPATVVYGDAADLPHRVGWVLARGVPATVGTNKAGVKVRLPYAGSFKKVWVDAETGATGADLIIDIKLNGTSLWATNTGNRPKIANGSAAGTQTSFDTATFAAGDYLTIDVAQVGSTVAGQDIAVALDMLIKNQ